MKNIIRRMIKISNIYRKLNDAMLTFSITTFFNQVIRNSVQSLYIKESELSLLFLMNSIYVIYIEFNFSLHWFYVPNNKIALPESYIKLWIENGFHFNLISLSQIIIL